MIGQYYNFTLILNGGVTPNRISILAGPPQTGKSFICYNIARNAQKEGYNVIYIDTEFSIELSDFELFGVDIALELEGKASSTTL